MVNLPYLHFCKQTALTSHYNYHAKTKINSMLISRTDNYQTESLMTGIMMGKSMRLDYKNVNFFFIFYGSKFIHLRLGKNITNLED